LRVDIEDDGLIDGFAASVYLKPVTSDELCAE